MNYIGDFAEDATVHLYFTTSDADGAAVAPSSAFEAADLRIYKDGSATQKATANGITMTSPFDSVTGLHGVAIDTSNDTGDAGFWTAGANYTVVLVPDETVDGQTVVRVLAQFSIENRTAAAIGPVIGVGARTITITVDDGSDPLEAASVRVTEGANSYAGQTDASGQVTFNLDDATYTVAITKSGYTFAGTSLVVSGDATPTYSMSAASVTPPSGPTYCTCAIYTEDTPAATDFTAALWSPRPGASDGVALEADREFAVVGDHLELELAQGKTYRIRSDKYAVEADLVVPESSTCDALAKLGIS